MVFFNALRGVLTIIAMIAVGWFFARRKLFDDKAAKLFSATVINVSLPAYMVVNLTTTYDREKLLALAPGLPIPFAVNLAGFALSALIARAIRVPRNRRGTFCTLFALSNTIFVGLPVNVALFGERSLPYVLLYYIANTVLFWTIATYLIGRDGGERNVKILSPENLRKIFSPPLIGFLVGVGLVLLGVELPAFALETAKYLGNLTTPLSMLFLGIVMHSVDPKTIKIDLSTAFVLAGRFLFAPAAIYLLCTRFGTPDLMRSVLVIQAAMPSMATSSIVAEHAGADYRYAATVITITTVVSLLSIPFYMVLLGG